MKVSNIITLIEGISVSWMEPKITQYITDSIKRKLKQIPLLIEDDPNIDTIVTNLLVKLTEQTAFELANGLSALLTHHMNITIHVGIADSGGESSLGYAEEENIMLNILLIKQLMYSYVTACWERANQLPNDQQYDKLLSYLSAAVAKYMQSPRTTGRIHMLSSTLIHELVHVKQHYHQRLHNRSSDNYEYRGYTVKQPKYAAAVDRLTTVGGTPDDYTIYKASPQELPAFAHEAAVNFIRAHKIVTGMDPGVVRRLINQHIGDYIDVDLIPLQDTKYRKVLDRFKKLLYTEILNFVTSNR